MSRVFEKNTMQPQNLELDLKSLEDMSEWSCVPKFVHEPIEEDGLYWVNYDCNTLGWHTFGPYKTLEEAKILKKALEEAWPKFLSRMYSL